MSKEERSQEPKVKKEKTPRWWNDGPLFRHHFAQSDYITAGWNWFMMLAGKAAEPFLFASVLYSGYKLLPGVPLPSAGFDATVFIGQQATLDIGGMGLMKLAQQANKSKKSFPYVVGIVLVVLMIFNVIVSSIERLVPLGNAGVVIEGCLLVARAIMAVLYGHAIHSLKENEHTVTGIVKTTDIYDWLDNQQQTVNTLSKKVDTLGTTSATLSTHLSTELTSVNTTLSSLTGTLSTFASKLAQVDKLLAGVDNHLSQVQERQGSQFQQYQSALAEVREMELAPLALQVSNIGQAVLTLGNALAHYDTRLGDMDTRLYQVEESQGSRFNELHTSLRAIVVEVRQATMNELSRGLSPLVEQIGTINAAALLPAPSNRAGSSSESHKATSTKKAAPLTARTVNQQGNGEYGQEHGENQGGEKRSQQARITRRLDSPLDNPEVDQVDSLLDKESEEVDSPLDTQVLDRTEGGKIISLSSGQRLDSRGKQADITAYILEFIHREHREPTISEIQNGAGCAKQTAINARNAAREILQQREQDDTETRVASN